MSATLLAVLLAFVCFHEQATGLAFLDLDESPEMKLQRSLPRYTLENTYSIARPVQNDTETVPVNLDLTLNRIQSYDADTRLVTVSAWLRMIWHDHKLTWVPKEYDGIDSTSLSITYDVWSPDIRLYNGVKSKMEVDNKVKALVYYTGGLVWVLPVRFTVPCDPVAEDEKPMVVDVNASSEESKDDSSPEESDDNSSPPVRCTALFGSWTYDSSQITIRNPSIEIGKLMKDPATIISDISARKIAQSYNFVDKEWDTVAFSFSLTFRDPKAVIAR